MCFLGKTGRAHIRYPYLDRAHALRSQSRTMLADPLSRPCVRHDLTSLLHVTIAIFEHPATVGDQAVAVLLVATCQRRALGELCRSTRVHAGGLAGISLGNQQNLVVSPFV